MTDSPLTKYTSTSFDFIVCEEDEEDTVETVYEDNYFTMKYVYTNSIRSFNVVKTVWSQALNVNKRHGGIFLFHPIESKILSTKVIDQNRYIRFIIYNRQDRKCNYAFLIKRPDRIGGMYDETGEQNSIE